MFRVIRLGVTHLLFTSGIDLDIDISLAKVPYCRDGDCTASSMRLNAIILEKSYQ